MATNHEVGSSNLSGRAIKTTTYSHLKNFHPPTGLGSQGDLCLKEEISDGSKEDDRVVKFMTTKFLDTLTLSSETEKVQHIDKTATLREKLLLSLAEQGDMAKAMLEGRDYTAVRVVVEQDNEGTEVEVEKVVQVRRWFYTNNGKEWYLEIRYDNKAIELAPGRTSILVSNRDRIVEVIETVIRAVEEKELDAAIAEIARTQSEPVI